MDTTRTAPTLEEATAVRVRQNGVPEQHDRILTLCRELDELLDDLGARIHPVLKPMNMPEMMPKDDVIDELSPIAMSLCERADDLAKVRDRLRSFVSRIDL